MLVRSVAHAILWLSKKSGLAASSDTSGSRFRFPQFAKNLLEQLSIGVTTLLWTRTDADVSALGLSLSIPASDVSLFWTLHADHYEIFTAECVRRCLAARPGGDVIDIGANIGVLACVAGTQLKLAGRGTLHAFEPDPDNIRYLRTNVSRNGLDDIVRVHTQAMGAAPGAGRLFRARSHALSSLVPGVLASPVDAVDVPVTSLDDEISRGSLASLTGVSLVKVDTEGYEGEVLAGAELFNRRFPAYWVIEYYEPGFLGNVERREAFWQRLHASFGAVYVIDDNHATLRPWSTAVGRGPNFYTNLLCSHTQQDMSRLGLPIAERPG
jgi:FkbM family methyltransferase